MRGARLDNGLLHIDLVRPEVESRVRTIEITGGEITGGGISGDTPRSPSGARADIQERTSSAVERIR